MNILGKRVFNSYPMWDVHQTVVQTEIKCLSGYLHVLEHVSIGKNLCWNQNLLSKEQIELCRVTVAKLN